MSEILDFFIGILLTPVKFLYILVSILLSIVEFGIVCVSYCYEYFVLVVNLIPEFLKPFFWIILGIRVVKFILKRGNSFHHSSSVPDPDVKTKTEYNDENFTFKEVKYTREKTGGK